MEQALAGLIEAIRNLQASQIATARVMRAVIASHPDPNALRFAWRQYAAPSIAEAEMEKVTDPGRLVIHQAILDALRDWDGYLERDLPSA